MGTAGLITAIVGLVIALIAAGTGIKALQRAKESNEIAEKANQHAEESNKIAKSNQAEQRAALEESKKARLEFVTDNGGKPRIRLGGEPNHGFIDVQIRNEGKAYARDVHLELWVHAWGERQGEEPRPVVIPPEEHAEFLIRFRRPVLLPDEAAVFSFYFIYRDDAGEHRFTRCFKFLGLEYPDWRSDEVECDGL